MWGDKAKIKLYTHKITTRNCYTFYPSKTRVPAFFDGFSLERAMQQQFSALCNSVWIYSLIKFQPHLEFAASL